MGQSPRASFRDRSIDSVESRISTIPTLIKAAIWSQIDQIAALIKESKSRVG
jgi:hypothetical protein